ncbi:hypothetical protein M3Y99_00959100 [Aphelenchoides fujianensis]|nr:hypothetical protein M3Y99_00959100 [Aphelenchoides fujianensis]
MRRLPAVLLLLFGLLPSLDATCPPGCTCANNTRNVNCNGAKLDHIPPMLNPALETLSLAGTNVRLNDYISLYPQLQSLDLSDCNISSIPPRFFDDLAELRVLRLKSNRIARLDVDLLAALPKLELLDLSDNTINQIDSEAFAGLESLQRLNLSANRLKDVEPRWFDALEKLQTLDLSGNGIRSISSTAFKGLVSLEELNLGENSIDYLHSHLFATQRQLKTLRLNNNQIAVLPTGAFYGLGSVETVDLSANPLRQVDSSNWAFTPALVELNLAGNSLESLDGVLTGLRSLRVLRLDYSALLEEIGESAFNGIHHLEALSAAHCPRLRSVHPAAFAHAPRLRRVDLAAGSLESLDASTLRWDSLEELELAGNPLRCDCGLLAFLPEAIRRINPKAARNVRCAQPPQLSGADLQTAKTALCAEKTPDRQVLIVLGAGALLVLLALLLLGCCTCGNRTETVRAPLYAAPSSSFSESLVYDKPDVRSTFVAYNPPASTPRQWYNGTLPSAFHHPPAFQHALQPREYEYSSVLMPSQSAATSMSFDYSSEVSPYAMGNFERIRPPSFVAPPPPSCPPPRLTHRQY